MPSRLLESPLSTLLAYLASLSAFLPSVGYIVGFVLVDDFEHGVVCRKLYGAFEDESLFWHGSSFCLCLMCLDNEISTVIH